MKRNFILSCLTIALVSGGLFYSCSGDPEEDSGMENLLPEKIPAQLISPTNESQFVTGDTMLVDVQVNTPGSVKNLELYINDTLFKGGLKAENQIIKVPTTDGKVGRIKIFLSYEDETGRRRGDNREVVFFSDIVPEFITAEIKKTFPHATTSYTQGLEFYQGKLFEGTGQYNKSILAEVDLNSGTKLREHQLDGSIFGEGITILNDTIYQITYLSQICYMYDMDFNQIGSFTYDGQGWGLCNDGKHLIMSNGSDQIVWRNRKTFAVEKTITVFDNRNNVAQLNELELVDGKLLVNLYQETKIAEVDTATGKVLTYITCDDLVNDAYDPNNDVLNGIAYNPETGKLYMTGKLWPKLYEVSLNNE